jgi:hypothetical protein
MADAQEVCSGQNGAGHGRTKKSPSVKTGLNLFFRRKNRGDSAIMHHDWDIGIIDNSNTRYHRIKYPAPSIPPSDCFALHQAVAEQGADHTRFRAFPLGPGQAHVNKIQPRANLTMLSFRFPLFL